MKFQLADRTPRERLILTVGAALAVPMIIWLLVWQPLLKGRDEAEKKVQARQQTLEWMRGAAAQVKALRASGVSASGVQQPPQQLVTSAAAQHKLLINRIEPAGGNRYNLWLAEADYLAVVRFIDTLQSRGVAVDAMSLSRQPGPGLVSVRLSVGAVQ